MNLAQVSDQELMEVDGGFVGRAIDIGIGWIGGKVLDAAVDRIRDAHVRATKRSVERFNSDPARETAARYRRGPSHFTR